MKSFSAILDCPGGAGTWTYVWLPFDAEQEFGMKTNIPVEGLINGIFKYQSTVISKGQGKYYMVIPKKVRELAHLKEGDEIQLTVEINHQGNQIELPKAFSIALQRDNEAFDCFEKLPNSHKKEYIRWISEAKKEETQRVRIEKAILMIKEGKKLK
jgi:AbrB family looped-hinge helix DNA binding protein